MRNPSVTTPTADNSRTTVHSPGPPEEPSLTLPTGRMLLTAAAASAAAFGLWAAAASRIAPGREVLMAGGAGTAVVAVVSVVAVLIMQPWRTRPITAWMNWWLGALVLRILLTPAAGFLLYSATALSLTPLMLAVATAYVAVQVSEAAVVAHYLKRVT
jgi:hypothetical protein